MGFAFSLHLEYNIYHCIIISQSLCVESNLDTSRAYSKLCESAAIKWRLVSWVTPQFSWAINQEGGGAEGDATERKSEKGESISIGRDEWSRRRRCHLFPLVYASRPIGVTILN